jgi:hypothetical protein
MRTMGVKLAEDFAAEAAAAEEEGGRASSTRGSASCPRSASIRRRFRRCSSSSSRPSSRRRSRSRAAEVDRGGCLRARRRVLQVVKALDLVKQEGLVLRHLLRLVILAGEFYLRTEDPDYELLAHRATQTCQRVDESYTERFLSEAQALLAAQKAGK